MFIKKEFTSRRKLAFAVFLLIISIISNSHIPESNNCLTPRLTEPKSNNKYYYSDLNLFYKYGYGIPNCTAYAYGRVYEILKTEPKLCPFDAREWFDYNKKNGFYPYGNKPEIGAIACWNNSDGGHIAVVEEIKAGKITFSNSGYGYKNFYITYVNLNDKNVGNSHWKFQGYIYILSD